MRLGYFTMPVHPMHRNWAETLKEDREAIILADQLGFYDAFMGEHLTDRLRERHQQHDVQRLADLRDQADQARDRHHQPVADASGADRAARRDVRPHVARAASSSASAPARCTSDAEALGILEQDRNKMFAEAIDVILAIWEREPPYDIDFPDNRYKVSTARTQALHDRRRLDGQALPEAAAGDRRHRGGAVLARRRADGQARLPSAVGELPAGQASQVALGELQQGQGRGRRRGRRSPTGAWRARSACRRRQGRRALRPHRRQQPLRVLLVARCCSR